MEEGHIKKAMVMKGGQVLLSNCDIAETALERMKGLLPRSGLGAEDGLWISPCTSIHTFFMSFSIDAAFLDRSGKVIALYESLKPWRFSLMHLRARGVLEAGPGVLSGAGIKVGEVLKICPTS